MNFDHIILEKEQKDLFIRIVETMKNIPRENRGAMIEANAGGETYLIMPTEKPGQADIGGFARGDLDILADEGLLRLEYTSRRNKRFILKPISYKYYEWLMKELGKPVERIEKHTFNYFDSADFRENYKGAYDKLKQAEELLWSSDSDVNFSTIGLHCREAMQEFADTLYHRVLGKSSPDPKASTVNRIREIIEAKKAETGKTVQSFFDALLPFWGMISDLAQRQTHAGQKEGEPVNWEDARRVVFQTANVMFELHRTFGK